VGALYAGRNPVAVLESIERLRAAGNAEAERCEVVLAGPNDSSPQERAVMDRAAEQGWVRLEARKIPQAEALRISQESDGLLLLQPQSGIQVPGKLFEYVRIGRPILSLAPRESAIEWLLDRCGIPHVDLYPDDGPTEMDGKVAAYLQLPTAPGSPSPWFEENFNAMRQAEQLAAILDRVRSAPEDQASRAKR
jgi:hypothetical protein